VYVKYVAEEDAAECLKALHGRWYNGAQIQAEYSPVTEFREARCRQFDETGCNRGPWCNFMHMKGTPRDLKDELMYTQPAVLAARSAGGGRPRDDGGGGRDARRSRSRSGGRGGDAGGRRPAYDDRDAPPPRGPPREDREPYRDGRGYRDRDDRRGGGDDRRRERSHSR
jgi:splicing factor U2AF subunit